MHRTKKGSYVKMNEIPYNGRKTFGNQRHEMSIERVVGNLKEKKKSGIKWQKIIKACLTNAKGKDDSITSEKKERFIA